MFVLILALVLFQPVSKMFIGVDVGVLSKSMLGIPENKEE